MHLKGSVCVGLPLSDLVMLRVLAGEALLDALPNGLALQSRHTPLGRICYAACVPTMRPF